MATRSFLLLLLYTSPACVTRAVLSVVVGVLGFRGAGIWGATASLIVMGALPGLIGVFGGLLSDMVGNEKYLLMALRAALFLTISAMAFAAGDLFLLFLLFAAVQLFFAFASPAASAYIREVLGDYALILRFNALFSVTCTGLSAAADVASSLLLQAGAAAASLLLFSAALMPLSAIPLAFIGTRGRPRSGASPANIFGSMWAQLRSNRALAFLFSVYLTTGAFSMPSLLLWIYNFYGSLELSWGISLALIQIGGAIGGIIAAKAGAGDFFRLALALPASAIVAGAMPLVTRDVWGLIVVLASVFVEQIIVQAFFVSADSYITAFSRREVVATAMAGFTAVQSAVNIAGMAAWSAVASYVYPPFVMVGGMSAEVAVLALLIKVFKPPRPASGQQADVR